MKFGYFLILLTGSAISGPPPTSDPDNPQILPYCQKKYYNNNEESFVCVCNSTYCDMVEVPGVLAYDMSMIYTTSAAADRLLRNTWTFESTANSPNIVTLNANNLYQEIIGFGGAFTDSSGINVFKLSNGTATNAVDSYFSIAGIEFNLCRVPIGSVDFSTREYSYDDVDGDFDLTNFALAQEDLTYKIPLIKWASASVSMNDLRLFGTPWSPPAWMKTNGRQDGGAPLKGDVNGQYYQTWANYFVRFAEEYKKQGVDFWGFTVQNEPTSGMDPDYPFQTLNMTAAIQRDFIRDILGPTFKANDATKDAKIMMLDDEREYLSAWTQTILSDSKAAKFVDGIGLHWYTDDSYTVNIVDRVHKLYPNQFFLNTEACNGASMTDGGPRMGSWEYADNYAHDIIADLNNWFSGWVEWNLFLDEQGGPNWVNNMADAPIIVNATADEIYKQPTFYILGHFSKFILPGARRADLILPNGIEGTAFINLSGQRVVVLLNRQHSHTLVSVQDLARQNSFLNFNVTARSIATFVFDEPLF